MKKNVFTDVYVNEFQMKNQFKCEVTSQCVRLGFMGFNVSWNINV